MEENKNLSAEERGIKPKLPVEDTPKEITTSDESAMPEASAAAIDKPLQKESFEHTLTNQPQTENMEVHHHGHVHEKKKWKEYLFQFLMLFLAVFCGFLAENMREDYVERHRENQFMSAMARDLELDSMQYAAIKKATLSKLRLIDSVIIFFASHLQKDKIPAKIYGNAFDLIKGISFYQNSGTLDQLKNSGGLRLITNRIVVDSIQGYDLGVQQLVLREKFTVDESIKHIDLLQKLFDGKALSKIFVDTMFNKKTADVNNILITSNNLYLSEYLNHLREFRFLTSGNMRLRDVIALKAANLLSLIKKEYHLK